MYEFSSINVYMCIEIGNVCIWTFLVVRVYVSLYVYGGMYVYMSDCAYVFMYYMHASLTKESEREVLGGQYNCSEERCYLSARSNNFISYKEILTFSVVKLMISSFKCWQDKRHNRRRQRFIEVLSMFSENRFLYNFLASRWRMSKVIYRKMYIR